MADQPTQRDRFQLRKPPMWPMYLVVAMAALVLLSLAVALLRGDFEDESMRLDCTPNGSNLTCEERR